MPLIEPRSSIAVAFQNHNTIKQHNIIFFHVASLTMSPSFNISTVRERCMQPWDIESICLNVKIQCDTLLHVFLYILETSWLFTPAFSPRAEGRPNIPWQRRRKPNSWRCHRLVRSHPLPLLLVHTNRHIRLTDYYKHNNVQLGASYRVGRISISKYNEGYQAVAMHMNASPDEIGRRFSFATCLLRW